MSGDQPLSDAARRVQDFLDARGLRLEVVELPGSTRTAAEAAQAVGCQVAQIAKSLVFRGEASGDPVLVVASGVNRVDLKRVAALLGEHVGKADAVFVRERTGFAIGGIPPAGHLTPLTTLVDEDLLALPVIWAAAGTPHAVFRLSPGDLLRLSNGRAARVKADA
ncbi:YbaK/EbsC family protein [Desulfovibrio aminophilus]|nr:YbaK/EbsC family protein [Desulfovibrio aminophilus]MCM0756205.1 YbaK/EbsC family protein [Desulfovibrio aminophilus]